MNYKQLNELPYHSLVLVTGGEHKGRIGKYDDDEYLSGEGGVHLFLYFDKMLDHEIAVKMSRCREATYDDVKKRHAKLTTMLERGAGSPRLVAEFAMLRNWLDNHVDPAEYTVPYIMEKLNGFSLKPDTENTYFLSGPNGNFTVHAAEAGEPFGLYDPLAITYTALGIDHFIQVDTLLDAMRVINPLRHAKVGIHPFTWKAAS